MPLVAAIPAVLGSAGAATLGAAAIGTAGTLYASSQANKAAKQSAQAQQQATDQSLQLQREQFAQTQANNQPYMAAGNSAIDALLSQYGLSGSDAQTSPDTNPPYGQQPTFERPTYDAPAPKMGDYGYAPSLGSYLTDFQHSPGYQNTLNEALRAVNAGSATAGKFFSGNRGIALQNRAADLANQDYNNWFAQQLQRYQADANQYAQNRQFAQQDYNTALQQYNVNRNVLNDTFNSDRAYGTDVYNQNRNLYYNRQDTATNDLFRLAGLGQASANNTNAAGQAYANNSGNVLANNANAQSDYYQQRAATNAGAVNNIAGIGSNLLAGYGMSQGANTNISAISPYGYGNNVIQPANYATNIPGLRTIYG